MSKLDELIKELCPNGVEYKELNSVIVSLNTGLNPRQFFKLNTDDARNYYITIREMHCGKIVFNEKTDKINDEALRLCNNRSNLEKGDVLFSGTGTIGETVVLKETPSNWNIKEGVYTIKPIAETIDSDYLSHLLRSTEVRSRYMKKVAGGTVKSIPMTELRKLRLPVPPLEVQHEIVRILDSFTLLTAELTAELTARKKQYEFYRDKLLTFGDVRGEATSNVVWRTLGEVATVTKLAGFEFTKYVVYSDEGEIIALRGLNVKNGKLDLTDIKYIDKSDISKLTRSKLQVGDMLFTYVGTVGQVALIDEDDRFYLAPNVAMIRVTDSCLKPEYMRYYFQTSAFWSTQINRLLQSSSMQNIPMEKIRKFVLPIPSLEEQERIVSILDRFDSLCNDLSSGLPAEIEARQKQYEYYRDKLLSFSEKQ